MTVKDTHAMIAGMQPLLDPGIWAFCAVNGDGTLPNDVFAVIQEREGTTLILPVATAKAGGYTASPPMKKITLQVNSDLEGVGLTAAVSNALATSGIACNVIAGAHHDHLFVPWDRREEALKLLEKLSLDARR